MRSLPRMSIVEERRISRLAIAKAFSISAICRSRICSSATTRLLIRVPSIFRAACEIAMALVSLKRTDERPKRPKLAQFAFRVGESGSERVVLGKDELRVSVTKSSSGDASDALAGLLVSHDAPPIG
jgi:hypothetical protein